MPGSNLKQKIENNIIWYSLGLIVIGFLAGWQFGTYLTSKSLEGAIEQKDDRIDMLKDDLKKCQENLANYEKKAENQH